MKKWSLQDIRPTGQSRTDVRGQIHTRPMPRQRQRAPSQDEDSDTFQDLGDFSARENTPVDEDILSEHDMPSPRPRMSDIRERRGGDNDFDTDPSDMSYGKTASLPRALRGQGIPITPAPVRLYIRIAAFLLTVSAIIGFFIMNAYSSATITIMPKAFPVNVSAIISASIDGSGLRFSTIDYQLEAEVDVASDGVEDVSELASGYITIQNAFSEKVYPLIKNTRFETSDKKIFRIQESVKIPGYTKKDGIVTPGSVVARVFADTPGEAGNIAPTRFTVPGFTGEAEFEKIYAESTEAFSGGIVGKQSVVSDEAKASAISEAEEALAEKLRQYAIDQRPAGQVLYVNAARITYSEMPPVPTTDETVAKIVVRAKISAPIFALEDLSREVAKSSIESYANEVYVIQNPSQLTFVYVNDETATSTADNIAFTLTGNAVLIRQIDSEALKAVLVGTNKRDITEVINKYPIIERISYDIRPVWKRSFPTDPTRITFDIITPE